MDHDRQRDLQLKHTADGKIDRSQGSQSLQLLDRLFVQKHAVDGIAADLRQDVQDADLSRCKFARQGHMDKHDPHNAVFGMQRDTGAADAGRELAAIFFGNLFILTEFTLTSAFPRWTTHPGMPLPGLNVEPINSSFHPR